jgi:hypothetical protein
MTRRAGVDDVHEICLSLPEGELVADDRLPFFTVDHVNGHHAVLAQKIRQNG